MAFAPVDDPLLADFKAQLDPIYALAEASPGFVWRLRADDVPLTLPRSPLDERIFATVSVWTSLEALKAFVYAGAHAQVMRRRREWFGQFDGPYVALWWVPAGHAPSVAEAKERFDYLRVHGPTPFAFSFADAFPAPNEAAIRTTEGDDRLRILLTQLDGAWEMLDARLADRRPWQSEPGGSEPTLADEEYFWEPVGGCWTLRRRERATNGRAYGKGEWVVDYAYPSPQPAPVTTIAWRLCHLALWQLMRHDYTFGRHTLTLDDITWPSTAKDAVAFLADSHRQWRTALDGIGVADLDTVGRSQMPYGLDPTVRFVDLLAWTNTEFAHHAAEIACLRDLYRARFGASISQAT